MKTSHEQGQARQGTILFDDLMIWEAVLPQNTCLLSSVYSGSSIIGGIAMNHYVLSQQHQLVELRGEIVPGWTLIKPLPIEVERDEDNSYIVSDNIFMVYGEGERPEDAQKDYIKSLIEYYSIVKEQAVADSHATQQLLRHLGSYLRQT